MPRADKLHKLSEFFGVSIAWILGEVPEEEPGTGGIEDDSILQDLRVLEEESELALRLGVRGELSGETVRLIAQFIRWAREQNSVTEA